MADTKDLGGAMTQTSGQRCDKTADETTPKQPTKTRQNSQQKRAKNYIAVGNGELTEPLGETAECPKCGKVCEVRYSDEGTLAFVSC